MLCREAPEERRLEQPSVACSRPRHEFAHDRPELVAKPRTHGNREAHLPSGQDFSRHEIPQRGAQDGLRLPTSQLHAARDRGDVLDELVVQIWHPAFEGCRHAHLILLHQESDQVRLDVRLAHPLQHAARRRLVGLQSLGVGVPRCQQIRIGQQVSLERYREDGEVLVEQLPGPGLERQERAHGIAAHRFRKSSGQPLHPSP